MYFLVYNYKKIRNFCIIAHIDHGKSTLADRFLEVAGIDKKFSRTERILDTLDIEQERGITVKLQTARLQWNEYILNLIDTPGHVDFSYEVSRSIAASDGALLLVDAKEGIKAQTISNMHLAQKRNLFVIPVINKIDLPDADIDKRLAELSSILGFQSKDIYLSSGRTGEGVDELLDAIVKYIPYPSITSDKLQALIFDSFYDEHRGVILLIRVFNGRINLKDTIHLLNNKISIEVIDLGYLTPNLMPTNVLQAGEVGYIVTGLKDTSLIVVGDTLVKDKNQKPAFMYKKPVSKIFASVFPTDSKEYQQLAKAVERLYLNDNSLNISPQRSQILGAGFKIGFLGLLHMDVFQERLEREFGSSLIITSPTVKYKAILKDDTEIEISTPSEYPDIMKVKQFLEPYVMLSILTPLECMSRLISLCKAKRGQLLEQKIQSNGVINFVTIKFIMPLSEVIIGLFDQIKSISHGYASMDYEFDKYKLADVVKVSILVNKKEVGPLSFLEVRSKARDKARIYLKQLAKSIPRHQFKIPLQAVIGGSVIARENIRALRKDVTARLHATSDPSRRLKLLERQKRGKARLKQIGKVSIPQKAFLSILKTE